MALRGLRQGESLCAFLFVLTVNELGRLMERAKCFNLVEGMTIRANSVEVFHLQFADDAIFFSFSNEEKFAYLVKVIDFFLLCIYFALKSI